MIMVLFQAMRSKLMELVGSRDLTATIVVCDQDCASMMATWPSRESCVASDGAGDRRRQGEPSKADIRILATKLNSERCRIVFFVWSLPTTSCVVLGSYCWLGPTGPMSWLIARRWLEPPSWSLQAWLEDFRSTAILLRRPFVVQYVH